MMKRTGVSTQFFIGLAVFIISVSCFSQDDIFAQANSVLNKSTASSLQRSLLNTKSSTALPSVAFLIPRGGYADDSDSEYDLDESEYDDESEEEEIVPVRKTKLSSSAMKASSKARNSKTRASKKIVNASLSTKKRKESKPIKVVVKSKKPKRRLFYIPYILKAMLNPFTVFAMTKGYFASLVNIDYLQKDVSQELRSALEEKAKKQGGQSGGAKRTGRGRKMKPGQAKTLSDLPVLNT